MNLISSTTRPKVMLVVRSKTDKNLKVPDLVLNGSPLEVSSVVKYLGHYIQDDLRDQGLQNRLPDVPGQQEISVGQLQFLYLCPGRQPCLY